MSMMLSRYFLIITLLNTFLCQHLSYATPAGPSKGTTEHQKNLPQEEIPFNEASLQNMITQLTQRLPQEHVSIAPQLAFLFVLNGIQDVTKVSDAQLSAYAQQMHEAVKLNEEQMEKGGKDSDKGAHFLENDAMAAIDLKSVLNECENTTALTPGLTVATAAYMIYRRLFAVHEASQGSVSFIPTRVIDWSLRLAAFLTTGKYKIEKYWPFMNMLALKTSLGGIIGEDEALIGKLGHESFNDIVKVWTKPDVFNDKLIIPLHMLMNVGPVALYHGIRSMTQNKPAYTTYTEESCRDLPFQTDGAEKFFRKENDQTSGLLVESELYKQAIIGATSIGVKRVTGLLQRMMLQNVDQKKVRHVENYTLGLLTPQVMAEVAKVAVAPLLALWSTQQLHQNGFNFVPQLNEYDVNMVGKLPLQKEFTFEGVTEDFKLNDDSLDSLKSLDKPAIEAIKTDVKKLRDAHCHEVVYFDKKAQKMTVRFILEKSFTKLDKSSFIKREVCRTALIAVGAHVIIRSLRSLVKNRSSLINGFYNVAHWMAQPFVKLGLMKNNPVHMMTEAMRKARVRYLADHHETFFMFLQVGDAMSRAHGAMKWTEDQKQALYTGTEEFGYLMSRMMLQKRDAALRTPEQNNRLKAFFKQRMLQLVERVERSGALGKLIDEAIIMGALHDQSFVTQMIAGLGGHIAESYGMKALRKHAQVTW